MEQMGRCALKLAVTLHFSTIATLQVSFVINIVLSDNQHYYMWGCVSEGRPLTGRLMVRSPALPYHHLSLTVPALYEWYVSGWMWLGLVDILEKSFIHITTVHLLKLFFFLWYVLGFVEFWSLFFLFSFPCKQDYEDDYIMKILILIHYIKTLICGIYSSCNIGVRCIMYLSCVFEELLI